MKCKHPKECIGNEGECDWCEESRMMYVRISALREQLHKTAVIIERGTVNLKCNTIGLLEMHGGILSTSPAPEIIILPTVEPT